MTLRAASLLVTLLTATGCFRDGAPGAPSTADTPHGPLLVRDQGGAAYPASAAPRDLVLVLSAGDAHASTTYADAQTTWSSAALLLRGHFDVVLAPRLKSARRSTAVGEHTVALALERDARELRLSPGVALDPGGDYTLFWLAGPSSQAYAFSVSDAPALGARLAETWPSQQAIVAPNLERALLRFDGDVADDLGQHIALLARETATPGSALAEAITPVPVRTQHIRCAGLGLPEGDCAWVEPEQALRAGAEHQLVLDATLRTRTGALLAEQHIRFTTGQRVDQQAPAFVGSSCAHDEQALPTSAGVCVRVDGGRLFVHGALDEAALLSLSSADHGALRSVSALSYAGTFELTLSVPADASHALLRALDLAGNAAELALVYTPVPALAAVSIDEVLADPRGKEPAQEWVELLNSALTPSSLMGFTLSTDPGERGRAITGAVVLAPEERALLVGPDFDARDLADGTLPAGVRVFALDGSLSIANGGAKLYLRDALGRRVSTAHVLAPLFEGQCSARLPGRARVDAASLAGSAAPRFEQPALERAFALDPAGACSPGGPTFFRAGAEEPRASTPAP